MLSGFEILNDATLIMQNLRVSKIFSNIFHNPKNSRPNVDVDLILKVPNWHLFDLKYSLENYLD